MSNVEAIRLERYGRFGWEAHWHRLQTAQARVKALHEELGI